MSGAIQQFADTIVTFSLADANQVERGDDETTLEFRRCGLHVEGLADSGGDPSPVDDCLADACVGWCADHGQDRGLPQGQCVEEERRSDGSEQGPQWHCECQEAADYSESHE
jgi:hypothetical protein